MKTGTTPLVNARVVSASAVCTLLTLMMLGAAWTVFLAAAGTLMAFLIHAWHDRHPSEIALPDDPTWRSPQINFSSTDVAGNVGGLIFVVGSILIVSMALPSILWFLVAATIGACFVAWGLSARHTNPHREEWTRLGRPPRLLL